MRIDRHRMLALAYVGPIYCAVERLQGDWRFQVTWPGRVTVRVVYMVGSH